MGPSSGGAVGRATAGPVSAADVKARAAALGFDLCGVAPAADFVELRFLREWLERGYAADMHYLHRSADRRADVRQVLPSARSVVCLGTIYNTERPYSVDAADRRQAAIARYAWGDDYHVVIQRRLDALLAWMREAADDSSRDAPTSIPARSRSASTRSMPGSAGSARTPALINPEGRVVDLPVRDHLQSRPRA